MASGLVSEQNVWMLESASSVLRYTLHLHTLTPIWVFRHHSRISVSQLHPSTQHRHPIESTIAGREFSITAFCRRERPILFCPPNTLACLHHAPIAFAFSPSQKGVRRKLHGGPRSPITNLPHLRYILQSDYDELSRSIPISSKDVDFTKIYRCDISALTAPRQRCGG